MVKFRTESKAGKMFDSTPMSRQHGTSKSGSTCPTAHMQQQQQQQQQQQPRGPQHMVGVSNTTGWHPAVQALMHGRLGVAFSGAGFGAAYQLGAAEVLSNLEVLQATTPVSGCSAGGFVAAAWRCSVPVLDVHAALKQASTDPIQHGRKGRMRSTLEPIIQQLLPDNAHELCTGPGSPPFILAATKVKGHCPVCWRPNLAERGFSSKQDLIDRMLAGAHEPKVSDAHCFARERGHGLFVDGGIKMPVAPIPEVDYTVIIYPVANQLLHRPWPYKMLMHAPPPAAISISPGQYTPWPYTKSYKGADHLVMHPQPAEVLDMLFERGRRDALAWAQYVGLAAAVARSTTTAPAALQCQTGGPGTLVPAAQQTDASIGGISNIDASSADLQSRERAVGSSSFAGLAGGSSLQAGDSGANATADTGLGDNPASVAGTADSVAGSVCVSPSRVDSRPGMVLQNVQQSNDGNAVQNKAYSSHAQKLQLLATPVSELPTILPIPAHLRHMLS